MSLENLVGRSLDRITPSKDAVARLLAAVGRHIADAKIGSVSSETRFGCAYTAIRILADVGLHAHGYRTLSSAPGHHATAIQSLALTFGVEARTIVRLDFLRKQRNLSEYSGEEIPESAVAECLAQAESLRAAALTWLAR